MAESLKEKTGTRRFERISGWNLLDYTIIADRNRFAPYADNFGKKYEKLTLTYFRLRGRTYPLNMFGKLVDPVVLEDYTKLSRQNVEETTYYLEINSTKDKVRVYREVVA